MNGERLTYKELDFQTRLTNLLVIFPYIVVLITMLVVINVTGVNTKKIDEYSRYTDYVEKTSQGVIVGIADDIQDQGDDIYRIEFSNSKENKYEQRYTLMQDNNIIYETSLIKPGDSIRYVHLYLLDKKKDYGTVLIHSVDEEGYDFGSPIEYDVKISYLD